MMKLAGLIAAGAMLAACTPSGGDRTGNKASAGGPAADGTDYVSEVRNMTPEARKATFLRAIRDAKQACQQVVDERDASQADGAAVWTVRCEDKRGWMIAIARDGNAKVTGPVATKGTTSR